MLKRYECKDGKAYVAYEDEFHSVILHYILGLPFIHIETRVVSPLRIREVKKAFERLKERYRKRNYNVLSTIATNKRLVEMFHGKLLGTMSDENGQIFYIYVWDL